MTRRLSNRESTGDTTQEITREQTRDIPKRDDKAVYSRSGEVLRRNATSMTDKFHVPETLKEEGWSYQWSTISVAGDTDVVRDINNSFRQNGWRPVPADRPGFREFFGLPAKEQTIIVGNCVLEERPMALTEEARAADTKAAVVQLRDRDAALLGGKANLRSSLAAQGYEPSQGAFPGRGRTQVVLDSDREAAAHAPNYQLVSGDATA
jgi:hypothetical protein